ncbi:hypothetical protein GCM10023334_044490 [Nonomuraea thailandensis]
MGGDGGGDGDGGGGGGWRYGIVPASVLRCCGASVVQCVGRRVQWVWAARDVLRVVECDGRRGALRMESAATVEGAAVGYAAGEWAPESGASRAGECRSRDRHG